MAEREGGKAGRGMEEIFSNILHILLKFEDKSPIVRGS